MSKVTFRSKQPYFQLSYMDVFKVGFITVPVVGGKPYKDNGNPNIDYAKCEELGIKDPDSVGSGYFFREGADHNEITLENEDVIEGIRAYIASRNDYLIVELVDGKEPADPEGTVFECKTALYQLYPAIYKGVSTAEGKTFSFSRGEKQNRYITNDAEEIKILRMRYEDNLHHYALQQEIASLERHIHHDIDNWEMDMSKDLLDELKDLEKKCRSVNQRMKKDIARNSQEPLQGV